MNKVLETVGAVHTHTHTHTSQFLNKRNAIAVSCESAFGINVICAEIVVSVFYDALKFINYIEDS